MSGKIKGIIGAIIGIIVIFTVMAGMLPDMITAVDNATAVEGMPTILVTIFQLWWIPVTMIVIGLFFAGGTKTGRSFVGRRRRRR